MIISFLNQKGGVGKSTASILIASALHQAGYGVALDDCDPQGSLSFWSKSVGQIPAVGEITKPEVVICDTPGRLDLADAASVDKIRPIIEKSDRLIIVSEKSLFSTHASVPMVEMVKRFKKPKAKAAILFNKVRVGTVVGKQDESELAVELGLPALKNSLPLAAPYEMMQVSRFSTVPSSHRELVLNLALEILK